MNAALSWRGKALAISLAVLTISGCATTSTPTAETTPSTMEVREYQTRTYETKDTKMVMKAVMNALQDENFVIKQASPDLGLLTATREADQESDLPKDNEKSKGSTALKVVAGVLIVGAIVGVVAAAASSSGKDGHHHGSHVAASASTPAVETPRETIFVTECTANVSEFGPETKVRISFDRRVIDNHGAVMKAEPVRDEAFYQSFFAKADKSIFLEKEKV